MTINPTSKTALMALSLVSTIVLANCSGGGSSSGSSLPNVTAPIATAAPATPVVSANKARLAFTVKIPKKSVSSSTGRKIKYISPATASITMAIATVNGAANSSTVPVTIVTTPGDSTCPVTSETQSGFECMITMDNVPVGTDGVTVTTNDVANSVLSTNTVTVTPVAGTLTPVNMTLNGVPASLTLSMAPDSAQIAKPFDVVAGTASTFDATVNALDADNFTIIGTYAGGLTTTLSTDDASGTIAPPTGQSVTFAYNGGTLGDSASNAIVALSDGSLPTSAPIRVQEPPAAFALTATSNNGVFTATNGAYAYLAQYNSTTTVTAAQTGWGIVSGNPFTETTTCTSGIVVTPQDGTDSFLLASNNTSGIPCTVTITGNNASDVINVSFGASIGGVIQSHARK